MLSAGLRVRIRLVWPEKGVLQGGGKEKKLKSRKKKKEKLPTVKSGMPRRELHEEPLVAWARATIDTSSRFLA